jgi:hypothetical protein
MGFSGSTVSIFLKFMFIYFLFTIFVVNDRFPRSIKMHLYSVQHILSARLDNGWTILNVL